MGTDNFMIERLLNHTQGVLDATYNHADLIARLRDILSQYHQNINDHAFFSAPYTIARSQNPLSIDNLIKNKYLNPTSARSK